MAIIGCDLHSRYQQIAMLELATGEMSRAGWSTRTEKHEHFTQPAGAVADQDRGDGVSGLNLWPGSGLHSACEVVDEGSTSTVTPDGIFSDRYTRWVAF